MSSYCLDLVCLVQEVAGLDTRVEECIWEDGNKSHLKWNQPRTNFKKSWPSLRQEELRRLADVDKTFLVENVHLPSCEDWAWKRKVDLRGMVLRIPRKPRRNDRFWFFLLNCKIQLMVLFTLLADIKDWGFRKNSWWGHSSKPLVANPHLWAPANVAHPDCRTSRWSR